MTRLPPFKNRYFVDPLICVWKNFGINQTKKKCTNDVNDVNDASNFQRKQ